MRKTIKYLATLLAAVLAADCLFVPSAPDRTVAASATGAVTALSEYPPSDSESRSDALAGVRKR